MQRIEKVGTAAYDSAQALAACFELPLEELTATMARQASPGRASRQGTGWLGASSRVNEGEPGIQR